MDDFPDDPNDLPSTLWPSAALIASYVDNIRAATPLLAEQLDVLLRVLRDVQPDPTRLLDLGANDGLLTYLLLHQYPYAHATLVDSAAPLLSAAIRRLHAHAEQLAVVEADLSDPGWPADLTGPFDIAVCADTLHRLTHPRKQALFHEVFNLLTPGGWFFVATPVAPTSGQWQRPDDALQVDARYQFFQRSARPKSRHEVDWDYHNRNDADRDILAPLEDQLGWLRTAGFTAVDVPFKLLQRALFGGQKPLA